MNFFRSESEAALPLVPVSSSECKKRKPNLSERLAGAPAGSAASSLEYLAGTRASSIISSMDLEVTMDTDSVRENSSHTGFSDCAFV